jgi:hypothetical protein
VYANLTGEIRYGQADSLGRQSRGSGRLIRIGRQDPRWNVRPARHPTRGAVTTSWYWYRSAGDHIESIVVVGE